MAKKEVKTQKITGKKVTVIDHKTEIGIKAKSLNEALFAFQGENLSIVKNGKGKIKDREYNYATLDDLIATIRPVLNKYGLMFTQIMDGTDFITKLINVHTGEELVGKLPLGNPSSSQDLGSRITYLRRYALISMLGLVTEEDVDGVQTGTDKIVLPQSLPKGTIGIHPDVLNANAPAPAENTAKLGPKPESISGEVVNTTDAFKKAEGAINSCLSLDALELVVSAVEKSTRLTEDEKTSLEIVIINKRADLNK